MIKLKIHNGEASIDTDGGNDYIKQRPNETEYNFFCRVCDVVKENQFKDCVVKSTPMLKMVLTDGVEVKCESVEIFHSDNDLIYTDIAGSHEISLQLISKIKPLEQ